MDWLFSVGAQVPIPLLTVLFIYTGRLVTRSQHQFVVRQMEYWREIATTNEKTMGTQSATIGKFVESAELQKRVMEAVQHAKEQRETL
jgi:hypothetical protein